MDVNRKLLIVDQDAQSRALKMQLLEQSGLQTTAVETGREALRCLDTEVFDLVLASDEAAEGDEASFYQTVKEKSPATAVLRMARAGSVKTSAAIDAMIDGYLLDPFEPSELTRSCDPCCASTIRAWPCAMPRRACNSSRTRAASPSLTAIS